MRFTDVVSKWPGSQHDAAVFHTCGLKNFLENQHIGHVVGDSGYPLRPYMLTPKQNPTSQAEIDYNQAHSKTRVVVEKAFGILKSRFRCLHKSGGCLPFHPGKCCKIVVACMKLHNLCIDNNVPLPNQCMFENDNCDDAVHHEQNNFQSGQELRQTIINAFENALKKT